jgi:hypothetical protein
MKYLFYAAVIISAYLMVGTLDYKTAVATQEHHARMTAVIWSKKCERKGMDVLATKADDKPWKIVCIPKRTLTAKGANGDPS